MGLPTTLIAFADPFAAYALAFPLLVGGAVALGMLAATMGWKFKAASRSPSPKAAAVDRPG